MPVLPGSQASSLTIQQLAYQFKADPTFYNILGGAAGYSTEPLLTICNDIMCRILAENMPWKWNRSMVPPFLTVSLQQDYCTQLTDVNWLEDGWRIDINNNCNTPTNGSGSPKPIFGMEAVRDLSQSAMQQNPFQISWLPVSLATMGVWQKNTAYPCGYGAAQIPSSPIQQFLDANGNILYIDSTTLKLSVNSPGYGTLTTNPSLLPPYGTSGATQPVLPANTVAGTTVADGSVTWTVASPDSIAFRLGACPPFSGLAWLITPVYQRVPPILTSLQSKFSPIPDQLGFLIREGIKALCYEHASSKRADAMYARWQEALMLALRASDRETESYGLTPSESLNGAGSSLGGAIPLGPAFPYTWGW